MRRDWPILVLIAAVTVAAFWPVAGHEFINYDDYVYVTLNREVRQGLTWEGIVWAFGRLHGEATYWHPLTWLSHMLDCQLFGINPAGHHLVSLAFHTLNALLLFVLLRRTTGARLASAMVAALFALHPLQVDSVAWVAERKNVLSTCFWMLTLLAYVRYAARPGWVRYLSVFVLMTLGLMAKPMLVTLPCVLLLIDFWPLGRLKLRRTAADSPEQSKPAVLVDHRVGEPQPAVGNSLGRLILEKVPLLALSAGSSVLTIRAHESLGAIVHSGQVSLLERLANAVVTYALYLRKVVWPADLSVFYPHPGRWPTEAVVGSAFVLLVVTGAALSQIRRRPYLLTGWLWFLGVLVPTIGLIQAGVQAMADRFAYVPIIGLFIMAVWSTVHWSARWPQRKLILSVVAALVLAGCFGITVRQLRYWQDSLTLLEHAVRVSKDNGGAHVLLGNALFERGRIDEALAEYLEALRLQPGDGQAWQRAGVVLSQQSKTAEAIQYFRKAIQLDPAWPEPRRGLALALLRQGQAQAAQAEYRVLASLMPKDAQGHTRLAEMLAEGQQWAEAVRFYQEALRLNPGSTPALNNLAWLRATCRQPEFRNGPEAVRLAEQACQLTRRRNPFFVGTLAAAYAEASRYSDAVKTIHEAQALARSASETNLLSIQNQMLAQFQAGQPFHESAR